MVVTMATIRRAGLVVTMEPEWPLALGGDMGKGMVIN